MAVSKLVGAKTGHGTWRLAFFLCGCCSMCYFLPKSNLGIMRNQVMLLVNGCHRCRSLNCGEIWTQHFAVTAGLLQVTVWSHFQVSTTLSSSGVLVEERGLVTTFDMAVANDTNVTLSIATGRRIFSRHEGKIVSRAVGVLRKVATLRQKEIWKHAELLVRASFLTCRIATFLANEEEYCVVKRKLLMKGKKLPVPRLSALEEARIIAQHLQHGEKKWRQCSGSFSTMMRFIQRAKERFKWQNETFFTVLARS